MTIFETPSQTAGPYVHLGLLPDRLGPLTSQVAKPALVLEGVILDGEDEPVLDALVELWDASTGQWLRCATHVETGMYHFALRPPKVSFVSLYLLARGINNGLHTRAYLEPAPDDPLLAALGPRAATLMAEPRETGDLPTWRFDIRLQGAGETVFLDL